MGKVMAYIGLQQLSGNPSLCSRGVKIHQWMQLNILFHIVDKKIQNVSLLGNTAVLGVMLHWWSDK